ncbi:MAG: glycosyl hydrolase-related protein, partial [Acidimicrobiales bacterium]|nr:glycosyl hydrolase-related protein [Acidimicrobiales bacterium]
GRTITDGEGIEVAVADDGTLTLRSGERRLHGLGAVEDRGDRGDSYDFDPVDDDPGATLRSVAIERRRHPSGIQRLVVTRVLDVPACLLPARDRRSPETVPVTVRMVVRLAPGVGRVDLHVETDNAAKDHRLRLLFPTAAPTERFHAATTFNVAMRTTAPPDTHGWWHDPPETFPHQGWVSANGLTVGAPGLPEAEVTADGTIAITVLRAVGWLSHLELRRRPIPAGPTLVAPEAQCPDGIAAQLTLRLGEPLDAGHDPGLLVATAQADELGLRGTPAGPAPLLAEGTSLLTIEPPAVVLSALKPAEDDDGFVVRVLNPTDRATRATITLGLPVTDAESVRLDETPDGRALDRSGSRLTVAVGAHELRSVRVRPT